MAHPELNRAKLIMRPLAERRNRADIERDCVPPTAEPNPLGEVGAAILDETIQRIRRARGEGKARMMAFGAHTIKNGLAPVLIDLIEAGWLTHLATNGAGIIHDWEFAYLGQSSEHVEENVREGVFGMWEETGRYLNLALAIGAYEGLGYGESVGALVENESLTIPSPEALAAEIATLTASPRPDESPVAMGARLNKAAAAVDLLELIQAVDLAPGTTTIPHPYKRFGLQAAAYRLGVPFTGHPMIGHDIIYLHPLNHCAAIGRTAQRDFLRFAHAVTRLDGGVYLSVGSAVMSPMIFEKSLSMAQNLARQEGHALENHYMLIVDMAKSHWDWTAGEPPEENPDYYLRYNKTFSRMGGVMRYLAADNRDFLLALHHGLIR